MNNARLTPAQQAALDLIRERGFLVGGTNLGGSVRTATVKRLAALRLITLRIDYRTHYMPVAGRYIAIDEWVARPVA